MIPFVALLFPGVYAHEEPRLWGFPFFYWYQFAWVIITAALTGLVYVLTTTSDEPPPGEPATYPDERPAGDRDPEEAAR